MAPTLLLDLDGTLVDSAPDLRSATNRMIAARGLPVFRLDEVIAMVGDGIEALVTRALAARGLPPDPVAVREFSTDYGAHFADETRIYPGVGPALQAMRAAGWRLGVCTNKPEAIARTLLRSLGLLELFAAVGGGDSFPARKPDPAHMLATLRAAGGDVAAAVACGDHRNDVASARGAGIPCIFAQWGYGSPAMADGAAALAARFQDVPGLAATLIAAR
jgi:phosphoglycolate phosphatase